MIALTVTVFGFTSCLNEDGVFEDNGSSGIVELVLPARSTSTPYAVKTITLTGESTTELPVTLNYTGVNGAPQDVQITLEITPAAVAAYDKSGETAVLPANAYELPASSNVVTIPKGGKEAVYTIKIVPGTLEPGKAYALGVTITNASAGIISGNYSTGIYKVSLPPAK